MRKCDFLVPLLAILLSCRPQLSDNPSLPELSAGKSDPIYTTYAAARERSNFVLDEGYEFIFDKGSLGVGFNTDTGGELGFGFLIGNQWVYKTSDFHQPPAIKASFPDQVFFSFSPFAGVSANSTLWVYSSHSAVIEATFTNTADTAVAFEFIPFVKAGNRLFGQPVIDGKEIYFMHEEYPDGWTTGHQVPFEDSLENALIMSVRPEKVGLFTAFDNESGYLPWPVYPDKVPVKEVNGRLFDAGGQRVMKTSPTIRLQTWIDGDKSFLLTESSPVMGSLQGTLNADGYFRMELAKLPGFEAAKSFTLSAVDDEAGTVARLTEELPAGVTQFRRDLNLLKADMPAMPGAFRLRMQGEGRAALNWDQPADGSSVLIYRKSEADAFFTQIAGPLESTSLMVQLPDEQLYSFIAVGIDAKTGETGMHTNEVNTLGGAALVKSLLQSWDGPGNSHFKVAALSKGVKLEPGESQTFRVVRSVRAKTSESGSDADWNEANRLVQADFDLVNENHSGYLASIPALKGLSKDENLLYLSGWNMMQQVFYPAEGKSSYPYYVFSREPVWGWGHGGQVFHESLTMLALALQDPELAMNSQRVFKERQYESGYINYRTGSWLDEIIEHEGELTSSAPWYAWINWEVYKITQDKAFLAEMYESSRRFYEFYVGNRDKDNDGLCEWGGHTVLESVRDASVAVWDEVGWPGNFEAVDLNAMLVMEAKSLEQMALALGKTGEAAKWKADHEARAKLINVTFWDEETGFYYQADKEDHDFTFKNPNDLKRMEIIGFLPLWAGVASKEQAEQLVKHLTDTAKFWRPYGIPSLAADDPYYNDKGYWNGPVWVEWNYLIQRGLQNYGYEKQANELVERVSAGMIHQLKQNHNLWEFYSPDTTWAGYHRTYIWAGMINRMLWDVRR